MRCDNSGFAVKSPDLTNFPEHKRQDLLMNAIAQELADGVTGWLGYPCCIARSQQNLANILWAFAKELLDATSRRAVHLAPDLCAQDRNDELSRRDGALEETIASQVVQKVHSFSPQHLSIIVYSFAWARIVASSLPDSPDQKLQALCRAAPLNQISASIVGPFVTSLQTRTDRFGDGSNGFISLCFPSLGDEAIAWIIFHQYTMMAPLESHLDMQEQDPRLRHLSSIPAAPSANSMVEVILTAALQRVREFDAQGLTNLAQSLAKLEMIKDNLLEALVEEAGPKVKTFTNQELAMLAWACARLGRFRSSVLRLVAKETKARLAELTAQDLSVLVWSFARGEDEEATPAPGRKQDKGRKDAALGAAMLNTLGSTVMRLIHELTPQDLSTIVWGYATAGVECPDLIEAVADEAVGKVASFAPQDMANVTWGLAKMGLLHEELLE
ncbi:unnamed protein product, partial [Effrenium voratum]